MDASFARRYGPWAVVTGAAMGLGAAFSEQIAARGVNVVLLDRDDDALSEQTSRLDRTFPGVELREHVADLADGDQVDAAVEAVADLEVGLFVACAAVATTGSWLEVPLAQKLDQVAVNCAAVVRMLDPLSRRMAERRRGGVIIVSSLAGQIGTALVSTYAATKAFDLILGESLWAELRDRGVDVLALLPGTTRTPGFQSSLPPGAKLPSSVRVMDPAEVVREGLDALGRRPSHVAGSRNRVASAVLQRILPRRMAIQTMARSMRALYRRSSAGPDGS